MAAFVEAGACLATAAMMAYVVVHAKPSVAPLSWVMFTGFVSIALYLLPRGAARPLPAGGRLDTPSDVHARERQRRHRLRTFMWWWWLNPLFAGLVTNFLLAGWRRSDASEVLTGVVFIYLRGMPSTA